MRSWIQDDASPSSIYKTARKLVHLIPAVLATLLAVSWGVSKLHHRTKKQDRKEALQPQDLLGAHHQEANADCALSSRLQFAMIRFSEYLRLPVPNMPSTSLCWH
jgi:hypothetical protein